MVPTHRDEVIVSCHEGCGHQHVENDQNHGRKLVEAQFQHLHQKYGRAQRDASRGVCCISGGQPVSCKKWELCTK
jgi:hypothetical protein